MRISRCLEDLQLRVRGVKVKADEDEVEDSSGGRCMYIDLEIFNKQSIKSIIIVDAVRQIDGVIRVDVG
jgi:putative Mg2+ transporter-C (MgtC) family protein